MADFIRRHLLHNLGLKLFSLLCAVVLWWAVARDPVAEVALVVPIEFHHVSDSLEISSENIPQAQIRVRGRARLVREISRADVHPVIDLAGARPGERTFDLNAGQIRVPREVEVVQVIPTQLRLSFDRRASKQVPVHPRVVGNFAAGFQIANVVAAPAAIVIVGPQKRVEAIDSAITDPVDATGVVGRAIFTTNAYVSDPLVRVARPTPIHVTVVTTKSTAANPSGR